MSKENDKKFVEIEDPLADFVMSSDDAFDDIIGEADEAQFNEYESAVQPQKKNSVSEIFENVKSKTAELLTPVKKAADTNVPVRTAVIIISCVLSVALIAAILIFTFYSGATYTSGKTVAEWANEWNSVYFTDNATYSVYSSYQGGAYMETMFISDTDHIYFTEADVKALGKGETVTMFDDLAKLSVETHKGEFKRANMTLDYSKLCDYYFGEGYEYDSYTYSPGFFDDSTMRALGCIAMFVNPFNDTANTESEILTEAIDLYLKNGSAYSYGSGNRMDVGDYYFTLYYTYEDFLVVTSASDLSGSDIASDGVSASDMSASDLHASVETHLIVNLTCTHKTAGTKKHAADWSWWNELFPKKEEKPAETPSVESLLNESASDMSASDASASDLTPSDIQ